MTPSPLPPFLFSFFRPLGPLRAEIHDIFVSLATSTRNLEKSENMAEVETAPVSTMFINQAAPLTDGHPSTVSGQGSTPPAVGDTGGGSGSGTPELEAEGESSAVTPNRQRQQQQQPWGAAGEGPQTMPTEGRGYDDDGETVLEPTANRCEIGLDLHSADWYMIYIMLSVISCLLKLQQTTK